MVVSPARVRRKTGRTVVVLVLLTAACSWNRSEPGLFPSPPPQPTASFAPLPPPPPAPANPRLPVAGSVGWQTGDGTDVTVRIAVHAVRRAVGVTVLDWSVTPLAAPGAQFGDDLPGSVNLGIIDESQDTYGILLVDPAGDRVYRPLTARSAEVFHHCLCTPVWRVQQRLRIGETVLLQVAYPPLPDRLDSITVLLPNTRPVFGVPITPVGEAPIAAVPVVLTAPAEDFVPAARPVSFNLDGRPRRTSSIQLIRILSGGGLTAMEWTLTSRNDQRGSESRGFGPPVSRATPTDVRVLDTRDASGPVLRPAAGRTPASWVSVDLYGQPGIQCLCTTIGLWAAGLWDKGGSVTVVTFYPALPRGTRRVDVELPGAQTLLGVPVEIPAAPSPSPNLPVEAGTWTYDESDLPRATSVTDWPTRLPDPAQLGEYQTSIERILNRP